MFPRLFFLFFLLALGSGSVRAQQETLASQTFKQRLRGQYLHSDTAQAIINLYSTRQFGGASWIMAAIGTGVRIAVGPSTTQTTSSYSGYGSPATTTDTGSRIGVAALVLAPFMAYGIGKIIHYSNGNLEHILTDYAAGQPLAPALRHKLKHRFFAQPIIKYEPIKVQAVK